MTYLDKQISRSRFHAAPMRMQTTKLVLLSCCIPPLKDPDFLSFSPPSSPPSISLTTPPLNYSSLFASRVIFIERGPKWKPR